MKIKKGNVFAHAKAGKKVVFKKPVRKRAPAKKTIKKNPTVPAKKQYKYALQVKKTTHGLWQSLLGSNSLDSIKDLARMYANNYPSYAFRVM